MVLLGLVEAMHVPVVAIVASKAITTTDDSANKHHTNEPGLQ
jgi:hypothetical protein